MQDDTLEVIVNTPEKLVWEGDALAVTSENSDGAFDILPEHANFVTLIRNKPIHVHEKNNTRTFQFEKAVIYTNENTVRIYGGLQSSYGT